MDGTKELEAGFVIGSYRIVRRLGQGGAGTVYEAEGPDGGRFALKTFAPRRGFMPFLKKKFLAEAKVLSKLDHPNIVKVYDSGVDEATKQPFFVMDKVVYKDGLPHTLDDVDTSDLDECFVRTWFCDLAGVLDHIHAEGIVHRDIKCANVLLRPDKHVMLSDFGISRIFSDRLAEELQITRTVPTFAKDGSTKAKFIMGTSGYMPPEVARGEPATRLSDVYSLGVLFFKMLTGVWYESGTVAVEMLDMFEYRWDEVLPWMLADDPSARPSELAGLVRLLQKQEENV